MRNIKVLYFCTLVLCLSVKLETAVGQTMDANVEKVLPKIHSIYIYHLTKYFLWPQESSQQHFTIGVVGEESAEFTKELKAMAEVRKASGQEIIIKQFKTPREVTLDCHILYLPYESSNYLSDVLIKTQKHPILVISAKEGLGKVGSPVNLITIDGKTSFELNVDAIEKRTLKFAQQLKSIAVMI